MRIIAPHSPTYFWNLQTIAICFVYFLRFYPHSSIWRSAAKVRESSRSINYSFLLKQGRCCEVRTGAGRIISLFTRTSQHYLDISHCTLYTVIVKLHIQMNIQHEIWIWCYHKIKKPTHHHHPPTTTLNFYWRIWVLG